MYINRFFEPLTKGDYPEVMRKLVGERLPKFSPQESAMVQSSYDFIGVNYYTSHYIISTPKIPVENYFLDSQTITCKYIIVISVTYMYFLTYNYFSKYEHWSEGRKMDLCISDWT